MSLFLFDREKKPPFLLPTRWPGRARRWALGFAGAILIWIGFSYLPFSAFGSGYCANDWGGLSSGVYAQQDYREAQRQYSDMVTARSRIVRSASLNILARDFDVARGALEDAVKRNGGEILSLNMSDSGSHLSSLASTVLVPVDRMDATLADLRRIGTVEEESQSKENAAPKIEDIRAHIAGNRITQQRLLDVLRRRSGKISEILAAEQEIDRIRREIESLEAQQGSLEGTARDARIEVQLREEYQAQLKFAPPSAGARLRTAAVEGYRETSEHAVGLLEFLLAAGPVLLFWSLVLFYPARFLWRHWKAYRAAHPSSSLDLF